MAACAAPARVADLGVSSVQFHDVVVPDGLRLIDDAAQSYSREEAGWRHGRFVYAGATRVAEAAAYVRMRMPQHGWQLVADEAVDEATSRVRFARGHYVTEYMFVQNEGSTQMMVDYRTDYARAAR
jgi:hypothetical protein